MIIRDTQINRMLNCRKKLFDIFSDTSISISKWHYKFQPICSSRVNLIYPKINFRLMVWHSFNRIPHIKRSSTHTHFKYLINFSLTIFRIYRTSKQLTEAHIDWESMWTHLNSNHVWIHSQTHSQLVRVKYKIKYETESKTSTNKKKRLVQHIWMWVKTWRESQQSNDEYWY